MCELARHGPAWARHGRGMGTAWHVWISLNWAVSTAIARGGSRLCFLLSAHRANVNCCWRYRLLRIAFPLSQENPTRRATHSCPPSVYILDFRSITKIEEKVSHYKTQGYHTAHNYYALLELVFYTILITPHGFTEQRNDITCINYCLVWKRCITRCIFPQTLCLPEDGYVLWPKHVG
jgi:hypothetical protein